MLVDLIYRSILCGFEFTNLYSLNLLISLKNVELKYYGFWLENNCAILLNYNIPKFNFIILDRKM